MKGGRSEVQVDLRRSLTLLPLLFYGLGVIVGAGVYVAIASVIERAGTAAPLSFLLAGVAAGLGRPVLRGTRAFP